jgi:hypothetical protein
VRPGTDRNRRAHHGEHPAERPVNGAFMASVDERT